MCVAREGVRDSSGGLRSTWEVLLGGSWVTFVWAVKKCDFGGIESATGNAVIYSFQL